MLGRKKTLDQNELKSRLFQTQIELRRLHERFEQLMEQELREARRQRSAGEGRPANYERIKLIYRLLQVTEKAYQQTKAIQTTDQLNRLTNELSAVLGQLNGLSAASPSPKSGQIRRQMERMDRQAQRREEALTSMAGGLNAGGTDFDLERLEGEGLEREEPRERNALSGDEELERMNKKLSALIDQL